MSHRAVSQNQFGEQLKMFMTPDEIIDQTNKWDTEISRKRSPREQWEHPNSGQATVHGEEPFVRERSLREEKLAGLEKRPDFEKPYASMPPVELMHQGGPTLPMLVQGHHRLAYAEAKKIPYLAVSHRIPYR